MDDTTHMDPAPQLPRFVALEIGEHLKALIHTIETLEHLGIDLDMAIGDIFDTISVDKDADHELVVSEHFDESEVADTELSADADTYLKARAQFSRELLQLLRDLRLYFRGFLLYQLKSITKGMLILEKLEVPLTQAMKHERRITRQVDTAHRHPRAQVDVEAQASPPPSTTGTL